MKPKVGQIWKFKRIGDGIDYFVIINRIGDDFIWNERYISFEFVNIDEVGWCIESEFLRTHELVSDV